MANIFLFLMGLPTTQQALIREASQAVLQVYFLEICKMFCPRTVLNEQTQDFKSILAMIISIFFRRNVMSSSSIILGLLFPTFMGWTGYLQHRVLSLVAVHCHPLHGDQSSRVFPSCCHLGTSLPNCYSSYTSHIHTSVHYTWFLFILSFSHNLFVLSFMHTNITHPMENACYISFQPLHILCNQGLCFSTTNHKHHTICSSHEELAPELFYFIIVLATRLSKYLSSLLIMSYR